MYGSLYFDVRLAIANDSVAVDTFVEGHTVAYIQVEVLTKLDYILTLGKLLFIPSTGVKFVGVLGDSSKRSYTVCQIARS